MIKNVTHGAVACAVTRMSERSTAKDFTIREVFQELRDSGLPYSYETIESAVFKLAKKGALDNSVKAGTKRRSRYRATNVLFDYADRFNSIFRVVK